MARFTEEIYRLYQRSGLSVEQLAQKAGIPGLAMWLYGKRTPTLSKIEGLADALGITDPKEREHFYVLALLAHCPSELESIFLEQFKRIRRLEEQLSEYDAKVAETGSHDRKALIEHMERLKAENDQLRAELAAIKGKKAK